MSHGRIGVSSQPVVLLGFVNRELPYSGLNGGRIVIMNWPLVGFLFLWAFLVGLIMETSPRHLHVL